MGMDEYNDPYYDDLNVPYYDELDNPFVAGAKMKFEAGDDVEVIGNLAGHNQVGMKFTIQGFVNGFWRCVGSPYNFYEQDLKALSHTKDKVKSRCDKARSAFHLWQAKLDYMEETHKEELEESDFKKHQLKKLIDNGNLSAEDKIERIEAIFGD